MKFVVRLLDADDRLLAWGVVGGVLTPGGRVMPSASSIRLTIEAAGRPTSVSIEWTDLDIARREDFLGEAEIPEGVPFGTFHWIAPVWVVANDPAAPRPPVTERQHVTINVPVGQLGAIG